MTEQRTAAKWRVLVGRWRRSGLSARAFATEAGVNVRTLSWWAWRLGSVASRRPPALLSFAEVVLSDVAPPACPDFVVEFRDVRVRVPVGFDAGELRRLMGVLC